MRLADKDTDDKKQRDKKIRSIFLRCIFLAFVIWMVFHKHFKEIFENITSMKVGSLVLILILGASYQIINAAAFYLLVKKNNRDFTMRQSLESVYIGTFGNVAAFSVGALPMRAYYHYTHNMDVGKAVNLITADYILHKSSVLICNIGLMIFAGAGLLGEKAQITKYVLFGYLVCLVIILALFLIAFSEKVYGLLKKIAALLPEKKNVKRIKEKAVHYLETMHQCAGELERNRNHLWLIILLHCIKLLLMYAIPFICFKSLSAEGISFLESQMLVGITNLVSSALPNVSGLGSTELSYILVFSEFLEGSLVSSTLVMYRLATYFFPFLISIAVFGKVDRQRIKTA